MAEKEGMDPGIGNEGGSDRILRLFGRPFFLSLTIGVPFCIFKLLFGLTAVRIGMGEAYTPLVIFGWAVILWACLDLVMNSVRSGFDLMGWLSPFEYCTIAQAGRIAGMPMVFLGIDTLLSFSIICFMLWSGWIVTLTQGEAYLWYAATTLNLISLSVVTIYTEYHRLKS